MAETTDVPRLRRGLKLGKYVLHARIGEGGFANVWKAKDRIEGQWVALKIPHPFLPGSEGEQELLSEIRLGARLDHPNILRVRNADRIGALYVIATDLATETLEDRLTRRLATRKALAFARQLIEGLAFAHAERVLHRDLKPANLMLFPGDRLRIADFGLAKVMRHSMVSATGSGSVQYAAPEQIHGYPCFASDVFSAGLVVYEMLTGVLPTWPYRWPFDGETTLRKKVPRELVNLVRRSAHADHARRFHDATEMLAALERAQPAINKMLYPKPKPRRRKKPKLGLWRDVRFRECQKAFGKPLLLAFECPTCSGPISEHMTCCPWCRSKKTRQSEQSAWPAFCGRCGGGMREEWRYCPWCWGPAYSDEPGRVRGDKRYQTTCRACRRPMAHNMSYCPWCHAAEERPVRIAALADRCPHCKSSVVAALWDFCPWCTGRL